MAINPEVREQIRMDLMNAPHGHKTETIRRWAIIVGMKPQTIYSALDLNARARKSEPVRPELRDWAKIVAQVKKRPPEEAGEISTDQALKIAVDAGLLPAAAGGVHPSTIDRVMRELGTTNKSVRATRFQAKDPNQAHHFDGSTSQYFHIARRMPDGEYILKMHRPAALGYKNKPIPVDRLRPCYYGLVDDHSGRRIADVIPAQGENAADSLIMLDRFWRELGVSKRLLADQGILKKCLASSAYVHACGVELPQMLPFKKRGHGKVENPWKTFWQRWEKPFYAVDNWAGYEITLTEFRRRLVNHIEEMNAKPHRFERGITRMDAWRRVMLHGGIVKLPEDALARAHRMDKRKVGIDGLISLDNVPYEIKGSLCDAWVYVYRSMFDDKMVVEVIETGERYEVKDFKPLDEGEFKNYDDTPHELAVKAAADLSIPESALLYQKDAAEQSNIIRLPIRETERAVENVFDVENYAALDDALAEVHNIVGPMSDEERTAVTDAIIQNKMNKQFVRELAMEMRGEVERLRAAL